MKFGKSFNQQRPYLVLFITGLALIFLIKTGVLNPVVGTFQKITIPLQYGFTSSVDSIGNIVSTFAQIGDLRGKNSSLNLQIATLKAENSQLKIFETENKQLREQIGAARGDLQTVTVAKKIGYSGLMSKSVLLVDKGSAQKVRKGDLAVYKNILLGEVVDVSANLSSVQLLADPATKIPVVTDKGSEGLLQGVFGTAIEISDVLQEDRLDEGDTIFTSGKTGYPRELMIGRVDSVNKIEKEFFKKAGVKPFVNIKDLDLIFIVRGK